MRVYTNIYLCLSIRSQLITLLVDICVVLEVLLSFILYCTSTNVFTVGYTKTIAVNTLGQK